MSGAAVKDEYAEGVSFKLQSDAVPVEDFA
jgi:hypothetical protein